MFSSVLCLRVRGWGLHSCYWLPLLQLKPPEQFPPLPSNFSKGNNLLRISHFSSKQGSISHVFDAGFLLSTDFEQRRQPFLGLAATSRAPPRGSGSGSAPQQPPCWRAAEAAAAAVPVTSALGCACAQYLLLCLGPCHPNRSRSVILSAILAIV
jgi:hypothetical protein